MIAFFTVLLSNLLKSRRIVSDALISLSMSVNPFFRTTVHSVGENVSVAPVILVLGR